MSVNTLIATLGRPQKEHKEGQLDAEYDLVDYQLPNELGGDTIKKPYLHLVLQELLQVEKVIMLGTHQSGWDELLWYLSTQQGGSNGEIEDLYFKVGTAREENDIGDLVPELEQAYSRLTGVEYHLIVHGLLANEGDMYALFGELLKHLDHDAKLYLDITHDFRHIPMVLYSFIVLVTAMREQVEIDGIYYGMVSGPPKEKKGPVINLLPTIDFLNLSRAVTSFFGFGELRELAAFYGSHASRKVGQELQVLSRYLDLSIAKGLNPAVRQVQGSLSQGSPVEHPLLGRLSSLVKEELEPLNSEGAAWKQQMQMALWHWRHRRYQEALTLANEAITTWFLEERNEDWGDLDKRKIGVRELYVEFDMFKRRHGIFKLAEKINDYRNLCNHGGTMADLKRKKIAQAPKKIDAIFEELEGFLSRRA